MVPPSVPIKLRPQASVISADAPPDTQRDKRLSLDMGSMNFRESGVQRSNSALQDELDMLQEENESLLEKAALKVAAQTYGGRGEDIQSLRTEAESAREEAASALEQLHNADIENKSLRIMTQRLILSQEEMEEVVLKRCWLARYWSLCVHHGILAEIATARHEHWSSFAPLPFEVVLAAGQKAKDENLLVNNNAEERENVLHDLNELSAEGNVESMLLVEKGLRELSSMKVEDAVAIAMAQHRRSSSAKSGLTDDLKLPIEGHNFSEAFGLANIFLEKGENPWVRTRHCRGEPSVLDKPC